ncbi:hypothetical protein B0T18DRAFT_425918 [Schizothecium vesticola]|uniref:Uncharacterized protein n=1 Tax=Schizothecium vesticola TaxID=314040 RepID=A0AA40K9P9_9PEZI|nr:hypothetical protein B0T18DRAFT_425918 [Schizothecium vesticola]
MPSSKSNNGGGKSQQTTRYVNFALPKKPMSTYEFVKPWGGMTGFMNSYGIKPTPKGFQEAQELITQFKAHDAKNQRRDWTWKGF